MRGPSPTILRLSDIIEAIEHIRSATTGLDLSAFQGNWEKRWLVERGIEIISEASRRLPDELKARHAEIPWPRIAAIGNVLRHEYESVSAPIIWKLVVEDLPVLEEACRQELDAQ